MAAGHAQQPGPRVLEYQVSRAIISDAVKARAQKALVSRHTDPTDLRSHSLRLTPASEQLADQDSRFAAPLTPLGKS